MIKRLLFGMGMAWLARRFMGGNRRSSGRGRGSGGLFGSGSSRGGPTTRW